jgi:hypothetical protein
MLIQQHDTMADHKAGLIEHPSPQKTQMPRLPHTETWEKIRSPKTVNAEHVHGGKLPI